ncbi:MAG: glycosyltransferase family 2 protein [Campylobacterota bacterium]|nr:glycosyltransferase family 2 protein [Campylobacterota bacterium]
MNSLISIITPSYKSKNFISQTIDSVLSQTYKNWEMIIVDDVSPDNSNEIIEEYCKNDSRIKLIKLEKNSGPAVARNRAIEEAKGRYIAFLDADDLWIPEKLEKQLGFMKENDLAFTYSSYDLIDEEGNSLGNFTTKETISYEGMLKTCSVGCLTAMYDTEKLGKVYMPLIRKRQDYGLWLKILKEIGTTKGMTESLATYRILENSVSSNKFKAAQYQWKIYREVEKLSFFKSVYYFVQYAYYGVIKYK